MTMPRDGLGALTITEDTIGAGRAAWRRIREGAHWEDWVRVGRALDIGRTEAMRGAHTNRPKGRGYNTAFSAWLDANGFGDMNKVTRSHLGSCMECHAEIEAWRETIGDKRHRLNHPSSIWRSFVAATGGRRAVKIYGQPARRAAQPGVLAALEAAWEEASPRTRDKFLLQIGATLREPAAHGPLLNLVPEPTDGAAPDCRIIEMPRQRGTA